MSWLTSHKRRFSMPAIMAGATLFGLTGCAPTGDLTVDLPDPKSTSSTYLDIPISAATVLLDPALTLKTDRYLVGRLRDQVTGVTEARGVLNLRPSQRLDSLPGRLAKPGLMPVELESVVLLAPFEQVYGTATAPLRFDVLPLATKLDERVVYMAGSVPVVGTTPIATDLSAPLNATREVRQTAADQSGTVITTTLPNLVVSQVLQKDKGAATALFTNVFRKLSSSTFLQADLDAVLPGIVLAPSAGYEGSIAAFGRGRVGAQLKFSFSYDSVQKAPLPAVRRRTSYSLFFGPGQNSVGSGAAEDPRYYTQLTNDRRNSLLASLTDKTQGVPAAALDGRSYVQAGFGLGTRIKFTDLTQLEALRNVPGVAINRAELLVPVRPFTSGVFPYPPNLFALEVDAQNQVLTRTVGQVLTERIVQRDNANPQGAGSEATTTLVTNSTTSPYYTLLVTDYLQAYLTPKGLGVDATTKLALPLPAALVLAPSLRNTVSFTLNRAVIDADNIHLRVYYSQLR